MKDDVLECEACINTSLDCDVVLCNFAPPYSTGEFICEECILTMEQ